jgi:hypothetical protein
MTDKTLREQVDEWSRRAKVLGGHVLSFEVYNQREYERCYAREQQRTPSQQIRKGLTSVEKPSQSPRQNILEINVINQSNIVRISVIKLVLFCTYAEKYASFSSANSTSVQIISHGNAHDRNT